MKAHRERGVAMSELISPVNGYRDMLKRKGIQPKNHSKDNKKYIKDIEKSQKIVKVEVRSQSVNKFDDIKAKTVTRSPLKIEDNLDVDYVKTNIKYITSLKPKKHDLPPDIDFRSTYLDYAKTPDYIQTVKKDLIATQEKS